ncbi:Hypothetical protein NGAL_HAMBI490_59630 [Neorhizobium galegae bv. officinalis]|nr:Hypothetical protein NGAL_HAMBI490_59630 [Neorhizobium galegae bv. officinalis]
MAKKALIKAAGTRRKTPDVSDEIKKLRMIRECFRIDTPEEAVENIATLLDRGHAMMNAQLTPAKHHTRFARADAKKAEKMAEPDRAAYLAHIAKQRMQAAVLMKLSLEQPAHSPTAVTIEQRIDELDRDARGFWEDGFLPHERREIETMDQWERRHIKKPISTETLQHTISLYPEQRAHLLSEGLVPGADGDETDRLAVLRSMPAIKSRYLWRNKELTRACTLLHGIVTHLENLPPNDPLIQTYKEQYAFEALALSQSKYAPTGEIQRLGIAIASADQEAMGSRQFLPDDDLAVRVSYCYGKYLAELEGRKKGRKPSTNLRIS